LAITGGEAMTIVEAQPGSIPLEQPADGQEGSLVGSGRVSLRSETAALVARVLKVVQRVAPGREWKRSSGRFPAPVHGIVREDLGRSFAGVVTANRRGLRWRRNWSLRSRQVGWDRVRSCTVGTDRRPGVLPHTHRLVLEHDDGLLELILRGPFGVLALVGLRDSIHAAAHLRKQ
jgi:hypothetical protein